MVALKDREGHRHAPRRSQLGEDAEQHASPSTARSTERPPRRARRRTHRPRRRAVARRSRSASAGAASQAAEMASASDLRERLEAARGRRRSRLRDRDRPEQSGHTHAARRYGPLGQAEVEGGQGFVLVCSTVAVASSRAQASYPAARPFRGVSPDEPQGDLAPTRIVPGLAASEEPQQPFGVGQRPGLDGPPEHQGEVRVVAVEAAAKQALDDRQPVRAGQATRRGGELAADGHARVGRRQLGEARGERRWRSSRRRPGAGRSRRGRTRRGAGAVRPPPCRRSPPLT